MAPTDRKTGFPPEVDATSGAQNPPASEEPELPAGEPEAPVGPSVAPEQQEPAEESAQDVPAQGDNGESERDHEAQLEHDLEELTVKAQKADEYLELAQRTRADFENYRKRAARESAAAQERGIVKVAKELLPAVDNLDRALAAAEADGNGAPDLVSGLKLVHAEVIAALARVGVELYSPDGEKFDPVSHEAVAQQPVEGVEPGTIVEVYQRGCRLDELVIRPARVLVAG